MKYTCIKQHDITDCGAACLATVSRQYGFKTSITKIRQIAGTDKMGTNAYGMVKAAEQLGFTAKAVKGNQDAFFSEFPLPAVAHVVREGGLLHYNADIGNVKVGDEVKYNLAAFPSSQYGILKGQVTSISKDVLTRDGNYSGYYLVEASIENKTLKDKDGNRGQLAVGMEAEAKIVTQKKSIIRYLLEKIDLF